MTMAPAPLPLRSVESSPWFANGLCSPPVKHSTSVVALISQCVLSPPILCRHKIWVGLRKPARASLLLLWGKRRKAGFGRGAMSHPSQGSPGGSPSLAPRARLWVWDPRWALQCQHRPKAFNFRCVGGINLGEWLHATRTFRALLSKMGAAFF